MSPDRPDYAAFVFFSVASVIAALLCTVLHGDAQEPEKLSREAVESRIRRHKEQLRQVERQEAGALEKLDAIDRQLYRESQRLDDLAGSLRSVQRKIRISQRHIDELKLELDEKNQILGRRLLSTYKFYKRGPGRILPPTPSTVTFLRQEYYLQQIIGYDHRLFDETRRVIEAEKASRSALVTQRSELVSLKQSIDRQKDIIEWSKQEKVRQLAALRREKSLQMSALSDLENYAARMQDLVDTIPAAAPSYLQEQQHFSTLRGRLPMPLQGRIVSRFGRKKYPGLHITIFQKGIDIDCPTGVEVICVYYGRVVYAGWFKGYGNTMIIDHGEGYFSLIAHASKLLKNVGDVVMQGDVIALSGDTGSLSGPLLHFEIRHHGKPQDPLLWLSRENT